jgi:methylmalonyl-CoA mutase C-terminal domain/subunit
VVAKPGLDGHDRGAKVIARALRDTGFEVIYTGLHQTPEQIAETVVQEDADAVGLSVLSGAHMTLFPRVMEALHQRTRGAPAGEQVLVFGGGIIPAADVARLKESGVAEIFGPGSTMASVCEWLEAALDRRESDLSDLADLPDLADLADNVVDEERARGPV